MKKLFEGGAAGAADVAGAEVGDDDVSAGFVVAKVNGAGGEEGQDEEGAGGVVVVVGGGEALPNAGLRPVALREKASDLAGAAFPALPAFAKLFVSSSLSAPDAKPSSSGMTAGGPALKKGFGFVAAAFVAGVAVVALAVGAPAVFSVGCGLKESGFVDGAGAAVVMPPVVTVAVEASVVKDGVVRAGLLNEKVGLAAVPALASPAAVVPVAPLALFLSSSLFLLLSSPFGSTADGAVVLPKPPNGVAVVKSGVPLAGFGPKIKVGAAPAALAPKSGAAWGALAGSPAFVAGAAADPAIGFSLSRVVVEMGTVSEFSGDPKGIADGALLRDTSETIVAAAEAVGCAFAAFAALSDIAGRSRFACARTADGMVRRLTRGRYPGTSAALARGAKSSGGAANA